MDDYGMSSEEVEQIGQFLTGELVFEQADLPKTSPWRKQANLRVLYDRLDVLDKRGDLAPTPRALVERLIGLIEDALPLENGPSARYHLVFTRIAAQLLAVPGLASRQQTIDWVQEWLTSGRGELLSPSLAAVVNAARADTLVDAGTALVTFLEDAAERDPELWITSILRVDWAKREERADLLIARLESLDHLPSTCVEYLFLQQLRLDIEQSLRTRMIPLLLGIADFQHVRVMLLSLDNPAQHFMVPGLVAAGIASNKTTTQLAILGACERIQSPTAEPFVIELLRHAGPGMKYNAVNAAGVIGTRRCLSHLLEIRESGGRLLSAHAEGAMEAIEARYPASDYAEQGSLTLSEGDGMDGALSLALGDAGTLTLYREVEDVIADTMKPADQDAPREPKQASSEPSIYRLDVPPRKLGINLYIACFYQKNRAGFASLIIPLLAPIIVGWYSSDMGSIVSLVFFIVVALGIYRVLRISALLRHGQPSYAEHLSITDEYSYDRETGNRRHVGYKQHFAFMSETGDIIETSRRFTSNGFRDDLEAFVRSGADDPILFVPREGGEQYPGSDVLFLREQGHLEVDERGNLVCSAPWGKFYVLIAIAHVLFAIFIWGRFISLPRMF